MSKKANTSVTKAAVQRRPPVRVKLRLLKADTFQAYPPDGEKKLWWDRLKKALGTASSDFVNAAIAARRAATLRWDLRHSLERRTGHDRGCCPRQRNRSGPGNSDGLHPHGRHVLHLRSRR